MLLKSVKPKKILIFLIFLSAFYIAFIKTEFFKSEAVIAIRNLDGQSATTSILGLINATSNGDSLDISTLEEYLRSYEMYDKVNEKFALNELYNSFELDPLQRLYNFSSYEAYVETYNKYLQISNEVGSSLVKIGFLHVDNNKAKEIVNFLVEQTELKLNEYNRLVAKKKLSFIEDETKKNREILDKSIDLLKKYQDKSIMIDPNKNVSTNESILSTLRAQLVTKQQELAKISEYLTNNSFEIINLKREISEIEKTIKKISLEQTNEDKNSLNKNIFDFGKLKFQVELNTEIYKQSLAQLQSAKLKVGQESKMLQVLVNANVPTSYYEPQKIREIITVACVLMLAYGIILMLRAIIRDHEEF